LSTTFRLANLRSGFDSDGPDNPGLKRSLFPQSNSTYNPTLFLPEFLGKRMFFQPTVIFALDFDDSTDKYEADSPGGPFELEASGFMFSNDGQKNLFLGFPN